MKKYFLMLVVALVMPLVFTSCGDDDDPTPNPDVTSKFPYSVPVLNWWSSQTSVKAAMANSGYTLSEEAADGLLYSAGGDFPMYVYLFQKDELVSSSLALSSDQDTDYDFQGFLEAKYGKAVAEDDTYWYYKGDKSIIAYGYAEIYGEDVWMATWTPVDDDTRSDFSGAKEAAKASLELVKKARNQ